MLSGFLITTLALREESRSGRLDLVAFYVRRVCSIYPLYVVVLLFYCVLILVLHQQADRRAAFVEELPYYALGFPEHAIFLRHVKAPFDGPWSLGIEEKFYLLWPLAFAAATMRTRYAVLVVAGCASIAAPFVVTDGIVAAPYVQLVLGCLAALLLHAPRGYVRLQVLGAYPVLATLGVAFLVLQFVVPGTGPGGSVYAPFGLEKVVPRGHGLAGSLVSTTSGIAAAYGFALLLHRTVERPSIRFGHGLTAERRAARFDRGRIG